MTQAVRQKTVLGPGGKVELPHTGLPEGSVAEVIVLLEDPPPVKRPLMAFWGTAKGTYDSLEDATAFIRELRDEWHDHEER